MPLYTLVWFSDGAAVVPTLWSKGNIRSDPGPGIFYFPKKFADQYAKNGRHPDDDWPFYEAEIISFSGILKCYF